MPSDWFERHKTVPTGDPRCDICAGNRDRPKPKPGERASAREIVKVMCEACQDDVIRDIQREGKLAEHEMRQGNADQN